MLYQTSESAFSAGSDGLCFSFFKLNPNTPTETTGLSSAKTIDNNE